MRISIIGQSAFGKSVLETLAVNDVDDIVAVFAPPTREGRPADPISETANALNVPVFEFKRLQDEEAVTQFKSLEPELSIMAFVTDIVPMEMINSPILGTIQYHPSLLPSASRTQFNKLANNQRRIQHRPDNILARQWS